MKEKLNEYTLIKKYNIDEENKTADVYISKLDREYRYQLEREIYLKYRDYKINVLLL